MGKMAQMGRNYFEIQSGYDDNDSQGMIMYNFCMGVWESTNKNDSDSKKMSTIM